MLCEGHSWDVQSPGAGKQASAPHRPVLRIWRRCRLVPKALARPPGNESKERKNWPPRALKRSPKGPHRESADTLCFHQVSPRPEWEDPLVPGGQGRGCRKGPRGRPKAGSSSSVELAPRPVSK